MRRLLLVGCAAALACGGSDSNGGSTVGGRSFTVAEARAVTAATGATPCRVPNPVGGGSIDVGITGLKIDLASYTAICADYATEQCKAHANAQAVMLLLAKLSPPPGPQAAQPILPGTYEVQASPTVVTPDGTGLLNVTYAQALATDATCGGAPTASLKGGLIRLDQVSSTLVTGRVDVAFSDGSRVAADFSAPLCGGVAFDVCEIAATQKFCDDTSPPQCL